jgi:DNA-binding CsgD family transcriptional regulator
MTLVEREEEVGLIEEMLADAAGGQGNAVLIEAAPGMGKSRLIERACDLARAAGIRILGARGSALESSFAFGVVRQLLEGPLTSLDEADRDRLLTGAAGLAAPLLAERRRRPRPGSPNPETSGLHGLFWLTANLAKEGPLLLCIDDAHWADEPSLRWLTYLARRVVDLPVAVMVATRPVRDGETGDLLQALEHSPATSVAALDSLSVQGTGQLAADLLRVTPDHAFVGACHRATTGSPLLLVELLRSLESERLEPTVENVERLFSAGPVSLSRAALARLRGLPTGAVPLTRAVAILERSSLRSAADLAGIELADAECAAHSLMEVGVLAATLPLEFVHPMIRSCVYADISAPQRVSAHLRAARLLAAGGADPERVASHLLHAEPSHEAWVLETLQRASATAWARGAPEIAVGYLRRALIEFPVAERPPAVLRELGRAEVRAGNVAAGIEHFRTAATLTEHPSGHARLSLELGAALIMSGEAAGAARALAAALNAPGAEDREWRLRLQAQLVLAAWGDTAARGAAAANPLSVEPSGETPSGVGDGMATAVDALRSALDQHGFDRAGELARSAATGGRLLDELSADDPSLTLSAIALLYSERLSWAGDVLGQVLAVVTRQGSRRGVAVASAWRALASLRAGRLSDAEIDAREALEVASVLGDGHCTPVALGVLVETLVDLGRIDEAEALIAEREASAMRPRGLFDAHLCFAVARLRAAQERWSQADGQLRECAALHAAFDVSAPAAVAWRGHLAIVAAAAGRDSEAQTLALEAVRHARGGDSLLDLGVALRAAGTVAPEPDRRVELLRDAVGTLRETEAQLELARALADLGSELRRGGARREATTMLAEAHELARTSGAWTLAERVRSELVVLGAKPRRGPQADRDGLTAAELRVAQLAAQGATNRRVANDLFISAKTVEYHLTSVYRKLDISSREELPAAVARVQPPA